MVLLLLIMRALLLLAWPLLAWSSPLPDKPAVEFGGFQPVVSGRGAGPSTGFSGPSHPLVVPPAPSYNEQPPQTYNNPGPSVPTKTIYVNVPAPDPHPPLKPIAAGPPRKHYKIVFIRAPAPPPRTQHILPPRTEQKTLIYVLHQRPEEQQQRVVEVPHIPHDPQVYFVEFDKEPTAHDLQQLSAGNTDGYDVTAQHAVDNGGDYGGAALPPSAVIADVGLGSNPYQGGDLFKRQVGEEAAAAAGEGGIPRPLHT